MSSRQEMFEAAAREAEEEAGPTLNEALHARGYTTRPGQYAGQKDIINESGACVFTGRAWEVWDWLGGEGAEG